MMKFIKTQVIKTCKALIPGDRIGQSVKVLPAFSGDSFAANGAKRKNRFVFSLTGLVLISLLILTMAGGCAASAEPEGTTDNQNTETAQQNNSDEQDTDEDTTDPSQEDRADEFLLMHNGNEIRLHQNVEPVLNSLGSELNYFEAESCAFEGMDKIYTYSNLEISTAPIGDEDIISLIVLLDDTLTTSEGLYIGAGEDEVISAYGDDYQVQGDAFIYTRNDTQLMFIFDDQTVVSIEYIAVFDA